MLRALVCLLLSAIGGCCCASATSDPARRQAAASSAGAAVGAKLSAGAAILSSASGRQTILITDATDGAALAAAVGEWVRVEGEVSNTKIPQIAGVDVDMPSEPIAGSTSEQVVELRGTPAWAEGILERRIVGPEEVGNSVASRGAGAYYHLIDPATGRTAVAHPAGSDR